MSFSAVWWHVSLLEVSLLVLGWFDFLASTKK